VLGTKGQTSEAITILITAITIGIGAIILTNFGNVIQGTETTVTNESHLNITPPQVIYLDNVPVKSGSITLFKLTDYSVVLVEGTNYTVLDYDTGKINITYINTTAHGKDIGANYTYYAGGLDVENHPEEIVSKGSEGVRTFANFIPILAIVSVAVIILTLIGKRLE